MTFSVLFKDKNFLWLTLFRSLPIFFSYTFNLYQHHLLFKALIKFFQKNQTGALRSNLWDSFHEMNICDYNVWKVHFCTALLSWKKPFPPFFLACSSNPDNFGKKTCQFVCMCVTKAVIVDIGRMVRVFDFFHKID